MYNTLVSVHTIPQTSVYMYTYASIKAYILLPTLRISVRISLAMVCAAQLIMVFAGQRIDGSCLPLMVPLTEALHSPQRPGSGSRLNYCHGLLTGLSPPRLFYPTLPVTLPKTEIWSHHFPLITPCYIEDRARIPERSPPGPREPCLHISRQRSFHTAGYIPVLLNMFSLITEPSFIALFVKLIS